MTDDVVVETLERAQPMRGQEDAAGLLQGASTTRSASSTRRSTTRTASRASRSSSTSSPGEQLGALGWLPGAARQGASASRWSTSIELRDGKVANVYRYDNPAEVLKASPRESSP